MAKGLSKFLYSTGSSRRGRKELDLREELNRTFFGAHDEIGKGREGAFLRKIQRDENGDPKRCPCRDGVTDEPDKDYFCRYCHGVGYFWNEQKIVYYRDDGVFQSGSKKLETTHFYFEYHEDITDIDIIVEVEVDKEGKITYPIKRKAFYEILETEDFRADNGRSEYWRVDGGEIRDWSVWYEVKHRKYG